jgi:hypothetical protein
METEEVKTDLLLKSSTKVELSLTTSIKRISIPEFHRLPSFSQVDADGNGKVDLQEFIAFFPDIPEVNKL